MIEDIIFSLTDFIKAITKILKSEYKRRYCIVIIHFNRKKYLPAKVCAFNVFLNIAISLTQFDNLAYELPHELPSDLRLKKLGNIVKISNLGRDDLPPKKIDLEIKKYASRYQSSPVVPNFTGSLYLDPNILSEILVLSF